MNKQTEFVSIHCYRGGNCDLGENCGHYEDCSTSVQCFLPEKPGTLTEEEASILCLGEEVVLFRLGIGLDKEWDETKLMEMIDYLLPYSPRFRKADVLGYYERRPLFRDLEKLTHMERQIVILIRYNPLLQDKEIGKKLGKSFKTIKAQLAEARRKLGAPTRAELIPDKLHHYLNL